ncbi:MAG TPA: 2-oxoglutarate dehydrogenase, E2 component, dihydrolipoamide succinyltransferase [Actinobacteria bacterium]|nr:2-oxoglutarate dehydrogenase, E2 component, dihydrolipoamide succinyltransferase [Actinomycetota bacterium]
MPVSVTMPQLGESVTEGTVTRWLKNIGDTVAMDEPLLEISTDKVDTEIPSPVAGVLLSITADEDATVEVGAELAVIGAADEAGTPAPAAPAPAPAAVVVPAPSEEVPAPAASAVPVTPPPAAPSAGGSTVPIVLPALGESVTEGTVTRWLKNIGDAVALDEPLLEISTDKVDTELPSPVAGTLVSIAVGEDGTVQVGGVLGEISTGAAAPSASTPPPAPAPPAPPVAAPVAAPVATPAPAPAPVVAAPAPVVAAPVVAAPVATPAPAAPQAGNGVTDTYVTPIVRKLASDNNIDLSTVTGTGVGGRIRKQDIEAAVASRPASAPVATPAAAPAAAPPAPAAHVAKHAAPASPLRGSTEKMSRLRKVIAERMVESLQTTAQLTSVVEVDVTRVAALRDRAKNDFFAREGVKLTFLPFFARAALEALKQFPVVNATMDQEAGTITYYEGEHLGIAVDTERGLLVPVIHSAGDLNLPALAKQITDIAGRTRDNKVSPDELSGGTFTLTNTGSRGALFDTPILNLPQSAILGTGTVVKRPMVITDEYGSESIAIRSMVYLSLTYDHRLVDGADAARFLVAIKTRLEAGDFESELGL